MWVVAQIFENILLGSLHSTWYVLNIVQYILIYGWKGEVSFDTWLLSNKINNDEHNSIEYEEYEEYEEEEEEEEEQAEQAEQAEQTEQTEQTEQEKNEVSFFLSLPHDE